MSDADLDAIRQARRQELQQQAQQGGGGGGGGGGDGSAQDEQKSREASARASILSQILLPAAADRLGRIRLVNAGRAQDVEDRLISLARTGQLRAQVSEQVLREMLEAVAEQQRIREGEGVTVHRRRGGWDEDDLDDLLADA